MNAQPPDPPRSAGDLRAFYAVALEKAGESNTDNNPFRSRRPNIVYRPVGLGKGLAEHLPAALVRVHTANQAQGRGSAQSRAIHDTHCVARRSLSDGDTRPASPTPQLSAQDSDPGKPCRDAPIPQIPPPPSHPPRKPSERLSEAEAAFGGIRRAAGLGFDSIQTKRGFLPLRIEDELSKELSALKNTLLDLACRRCRSQSLDCDRSRPSCWNCQQGFQQCSYKHDVTDTSDGGDAQCMGAPVGSTLESISWLDSLRNRRYHTADKEQKMSQMDILMLKQRHSDRHSKPVVSCKNLAVELAEDEEREALLWEAFIWTTPVDENPPTIDIDIAAGTASLRGLPVDTPARVDTPVHSYCSTITSTPSQYTISLIFSDELESSASTRLTSWSANSTQTTFSHPGSLESCPDRRPRPFQCTFCLEQCEDEQDWKRHERSQHRQQEWICMPEGPTEEIDRCNICVFCDAVDPDASHFSLHNSEPCFSLEVEDRTFMGEGEFQEHLRVAHNQLTVTRHMQDNWWWHPKDEKYYWNCGFCDLLLTSWSHRVKHIGNHFQEGMTMASWDPLMPPSPLDKDTLTCTARFPHVGWNTETLWALQFEQCSQVGSKRGERHPCQYCDTHFETKADTARHEEIWHHPRHVWCCPTMSDLRAAIHLQTGPLDRYLFPTAQAPEESDEDACPYCGYEFNDDEDWEVHIEHLNIKHSFGKCNPLHTFYRSDHLMIHLANVHNIVLSDCFAEIVNSCRKAERILVKRGARDLSLG